MNLEKAKQKIASLETENQALNERITELKQLDSERELDPQPKSKKSFKVGLHRSKKKNHSKGFGS